MDISYDNPRWKLCSFNHYSHPNLDSCKNATMKVQMIHAQALQMVHSTLPSSGYRLLSQLSTLPICHSCPNTWVLIWQTFKLFHDRAQRTMTPCKWNWWRNIAYVLTSTVKWEHFSRVWGEGTIYEGVTLVHVIPPSSCRQVCLKNS
jgi:hypothetical protein